ncbi:FtsX-like permease family protein [Pseudodesulfovibrio sp. F-1]|uniref:FtsX-like permease family protein n=1 Tax=Pseudodesulfovibrio alkaliphilus TaxID=2661613 RepID=A0A7K1KM08_9BACT|nr:FtsX-like permease family protein [Pseudodesulfovibrio alkaliphilus]MUM77095.1 FtsX-like permease family protein [Pseudodesulfovibrio alkaliphilus]
MIRRWLLALASLVLLAPAALAASGMPGGLHGDFVRRLAELGDRSPGTPGAARAAAMVEAEFSRLFPGALTGRQTFRVPVVAAGGAELRVMGTGRSAGLRQLRVNAMSPGAVAPPGLRGPLLYVGQGEIKDFNGLDVEGAVVLMDMDSGKNWSNAAMLGARSLIFLGEASDGGPSPRSLFDSKFELTPLDFPLFWMDVEQARTLFGQDVASGGPRRLATVQLASRAAWRGVSAENVYCLVPGSDPDLAGQTLILEAFYDATALAAGDGPGADEGVSIATLMDVAAELSGTRPKRSVMLVATAGKGSAQAGMREFTWALVTKGARLKERRDDLDIRVREAARTIEILDMGDPFDAQAMADAADRALVKRAIKAVVRDREDDLTNELMRLRLQSQAERMGMEAGPRGGGDHAMGERPGHEAMAEAARQDRIRHLAAQRIMLKRLNWVHSTVASFPLGDEERLVLAEFVAPARAYQAAILKDATGQLEDIRSARALRDAIGERSIAAHVSLYLSSHGDGVGGFDKGWLHDLMPSVNRTAFFRPLDTVMKRAVKDVTPHRPDVAALFKDTLRPGRRAWQSYLPDMPELGGEPMALAGFPGLTLATVHDARPAWGTPYDRPERVNFAFAGKQAALVRTLVRALADQPIDNAGERANSHFVTLEGRANLLRKGEIFPDRPGTDMVVLASQWQTLNYGMVDTAGRFRIPGFADRKVSYHKAVIEALRFDDKTGLAVWAVDKPKTGKDSYRVKLSRAVQGTDLTLFSCTQTTLFNLVDPRSFRYLYIPTLIDGRTEAPPVSYWYSRLDTRSSTLGTLFLEPDTPIKLTLSDSVLDKKVLLLNADPEHPQGLGYIARLWPVIPLTEFRAARDMWSLLDPRIDNLEDKGIVNERIRTLRRQGDDDLRRAEVYREQKRWDRFVEASRASLAKASRVYGDVDKTQKDVLLGVLFYVALFVPFAYCMERLFFSYADIKKRIAAFLGFLILIIGVVYFVHPAFQLTYSPLVVILAFFILALSLLVSLIIFMRFEREMVELQKRSSHIKLTGISPMAAFGAAFVLGVGNLKRRPVRTFLTFATLVILTFTIMNFTTVKSVRQKGWANFSATATYEGLMLKYINWQDVPLEALSAVENAFEGSGVVAPRAWYDTGLTSDKSRAPLIPVFLGDRESPGRGMVGLSHREPEVSGLDRILVKGRWFREDERFAVILPERMAGQLGADPEDPARSTVTIWGIPMTLVGVFSDDGLRLNPDLDGEPMTPIVFPNVAASQLSEVEAEAIEEGQDIVTTASRYQHIPDYETILVPARTLLSLGGCAGRLKGIAVKPHAGEAAITGDLGDRFGMLLFRGSSTGTSLYYAADAVSYSGMANIMIPLGIAVLIVLNTMIGSVYERKPEIAVYTSVGLAPPHVAFLFIAEALAFAVISVVVGYLLAQGASAVLAGTPLWEGMTANYSSTAGVAAMLLVMAVVLVSAMYPARVAASIAIPDVNRSWTMPRAVGDELTVVLPFLIKLGEMSSAGGFLRQYYLAHHDVSHGAFCTDDMQCNFLDLEEQEARTGLLAGVADRVTIPDDMCFSMSLRVWLAPFDFGVRQKVRLVFCPSDLYAGFRQVKVVIQREAGEFKAWENLNRNFINDLRKQLLAWRSLDEVAVGHYAADLDSVKRDTAMGKRIMAAAREAGQ